MASSTPRSTEQIQAELTLLEDMQDKQYDDNIEIQIEGLYEELESAKTKPSLGASPRTNPSPAASVNPVGESTATGKKLIGLIILIAIVSFSVIKLPGLLRSNLHSDTNPSSPSSYNAKDDNHAIKYASIATIKSQSAELNAIAHTIAPNNVFAITSAYGACVSESQQKSYCTDDTIQAPLHVTEVTPRGTETADKIRQVMARSAGWKELHYSGFDADYKSIDPQKLESSNEYSLSLRYQYIQDGHAYCIDARYQKTITADRYDVNWDGSLGKC